MGRVKINWPEVQPYLQSLAPAPRRRIRKAIRLLSDNPRPRGLNIKILETDSSGAKFYRIRIGDHRIVYSVHGAVVYVHRVFHREDGYGWLERI